MTLVVDALLTLGPNTLWDTNIASDCTAHHVGHLSCVRLWRQVLISSCAILLSKGYSVVSDALQGA